MQYCQECRERFHLPASDEIATAHCSLCGKHRACFVSDLIPEELEHLVRRGFSFLERAQNVVALGTEELRNMVGEVGERLRKMAEERARPTEGCASAGRARAGDCCGQCDKSSKSDNPVPDDLVILEIAPEDSMGPSASSSKDSLEVENIDEDDVMDHDPCVLLMIALHDGAWEAFLDQRAEMRAGGVVYPQSALAPDDAAALRSVFDSIAAIASDAEVDDRSFRRIVHEIAKSHGRQSTSALGRQRR